MIHWCFLPITVAVALCVAVRWLLGKITYDKQILIHVDEFIGNFVSAVYIFELFAISAEHGPNSITSVVCGFVHLFFKHIYFEKNSLYGSPLSFLDIFYTNSKMRNFTILEIFTIILTQIFSLIAGQRFSKLMWSLSQDDMHAQLLHETCHTTLSPSFTLQYAMFIEAGGVFICTMIDFLTPMRMKPLVSSCVILTLLWNFGHVSGLWMNPVLATVFTFRCKGHTDDWRHVLVYWVGPVIAFSLAWELKMLAASFFARNKVVS